MGKVHGSLARAGKVKGQTPKVAKQEKKKRLVDQEQAFGSDSTSCCCRSWWSVEVFQYPDEEAWIPGGHGCFGPVSVCYRGLLTLGAGDDVARRQRSTRTRVRTEREASASVTRA